MFIRLPEEDKIIKRCPNHCVPTVDDTILRDKIILMEIIGGKNGTYCEVCGTLLTEYRVSQPDNIQCSECKREIPLGEYAHYCPYCGKPRV